MNNERINNEYKRWLLRTAQSPYADNDITRELSALSNSPAELSDAFYCELSFGTGGLRGKIGAGTNRMNIFTVARTSQGIADYLSSLSNDAAHIAVSFDSRIKSELFAQIASGVFAANGLIVHIFPQLMPTPLLSYAVRKLGCECGVMITASHNPAEYNGYKVYGADGGQITTKAATDITKRISMVDIFDGVRYSSFEKSLESGEITRIPDCVYTDYINAVRAQSVLYGDYADRNAPIVYTPLNGTGLAPVLRVLSESGFDNVLTVPEQTYPNGLFPSCPRPNPENAEALSLAIEYAQKCGAELVIATDPDCDRVGVAVKAEDGKFELLSGNEVGLLLLDFICSQRTKHATLPQSGVMIKTIVTAELAERIAADYGLETINVLTGFKYIGEQVGILEQLGCVQRFVFGMEDSCGYMGGSYVRDKDGVFAAMMIAELFAYCRFHGTNLYEWRNELYARYGFQLNTLHSYELSGEAGSNRISELMKQFRRGIDTIGGIRVESFKDYINGQNELPPSDVLQFSLKGGSSVIIRPSGTEPKLKAYLSVNAANRARAAKTERAIVEWLSRLVEQSTDDEY